DEIQFHLEQQIAENTATGMSPEDARHAAMRVFGNPTLTKEQARDTWGWTWLEHFAQDLRYGLRTLRKNFAFTAVAVLTLALGIGANTAIFQLIDALRLRAIPVKEPQQLVTVQLADSTGVRGNQASGYPVLTNPVYSATSRTCSPAFSPGAVMVSASLPRAKVGLLKAFSSAAIFSRYSVCGP